MAHRAEKISTYDFKSSEALLLGYTRARRPVELVYREMVSDRGAAVRRECAIKRLRPIAKRKLITKSGEPKWTSGGI